MAKDFELSIDLDRFVKDLKATEQDVKEGAAEALVQIKDDWVREARDIAPLSKGGGNLRRQIDGEVERNDTVIVTGNATEKSRGYGRFNYGYWLHEKAPASTKLTTPGTELKFLDKSAEKRERKWQKWLDEEIKDATRRWR